MTERVPNYRFATPQPDHIMVSFFDDPRSNMAITWRTSADVPSGYAELHKENGERFRVSAVTKVFKSDVNISHIHFARCTGLESGTRYYYTIGDDERRSEEFYFDTQPENLDAFSFICISDHQKDDDHYNQDYSTINDSLKSVLSRHPQVKFIYTAGDNTNCGQHEIQWNAMFEGMKGIIEHIPYMMTCGNHDNRGFEFYFPEEKNRYYAEPADFFNTQLELSYPDNGPEGWRPENYSFDYGNAHFVVYGVNEPELVNEWASRDIDSCGKKWKFGSYHFPIYYSGANLSNDDGYPMTRESMEKLDVLFSGHEHDFSRTYPIKNEELFDRPSQGTIHYELGNGNFNPPDTKTSCKIWHCSWFPQEEDVSAYALVEIDGDTAHITSHLSDGRISDECFIDKDKDEIIPRRLAPVFGPGRTRMFYKGMDPGLGAARCLPVNKDGIWFISAGTLVSFIGGDVLREKGRMTLSVYGKSAVFTEGGITASTGAGDYTLSAPVFRGGAEQLYVPVDDVCKIFGMKWAYAKRNNFITIESSNESEPAPTQP